MYKLLRTGAVVERLVLAQVREAIKKGHIKRRGEFLWSWRVDTVKPRRPEDGIPLRRIEHVPPEELEAAALVVARLAGGITTEELIPEVARVLGYMRTGANVEKAARGAVSRLIEAGILIERGNFFVPREDALPSRTSTKEHCQEGDAEEDSVGDACSPEGDAGRSAPSQASPWSPSSTGLQERAHLMAKPEEPWTQLATRIPKDLHQRLKLHCVTNDIAVMHFVVEAIEERLGRTRGPKKGTD